MYSTHEYLAHTLNEGGCRVCIQSRLKNTEILTCTEPEVCQICTQAAPGNATVVLESKRSLLCYAFTHVHVHTCCVDVVSECL